MVQHLMRAMQRLFPTAVTRYALGLALLNVYTNSNLELDVFNVSDLPG